MTTSNRRRRVRLGLAALGATVAGLTMTGGVAGATTSQASPYQLPDRAQLANVQLDPDIVHIDSVRPTPMLPAGVQKTDLCIRSLNGTFQILPARLCP